MARDWPRQKNIHWLVTRYRPPPPTKKYWFLLLTIVPRENVTLNLILGETGRPVAWDEAFLYRQAFVGSEEDFKAYFQFPYKQLVLKICLVDF